MIGSISEWELLGKILIAAVLGSVLGYEREIRQKPAGLRTHMLVGAAAALLTGVGPFVVMFYQGMSPEIVRADVMRLVHGMIVGISFLGAGTIFLHHREDRIEGLTTAASILFTVGIGVVVALELYTTAVFATILILIIGLALRRLEARMPHNGHKYAKPKKKK
ncbi:MgtC/SapB family protein [Candidatus Woesearchaeota archaeon]|nr:MgtC/SapB family protein [Candidatus Woesearchaeota archaeon]